jgi:hypothetical protein
VRLPRMTTRRWMVLVAVVALVFASAATIVRLRSLRDLYECCAALCEAHADVLEGAGRVHSVCSRSDLLFGSSSPAPDTTPHQAELTAPQYRRLARIYQRAARYPWLPVPPDPPEPK